VETGLGGAAADLAHSVNRLIRLALPRFADTALVDVRLGDGELMCVYATHNLDEWDPILRLEVGRAPKPGSPRDRVGRSGRALLFPRVDDAALANLARDAEHLRTLRDMGVRSMLSVPMFADERLIGALSFGLTGGEREFDETDLAIAAELARHVASVAWVALLGAEERRLRELSQRAAERMGRLQAITSALSRAPDGKQVAGEILRHGAEGLGAEAGVFATVDRDSLVVLRSFGVPGTPAGRRIPLGLELPLTEAVRRRVPILIDSAGEVRRRFPLFESVAEVHAGGLAAVPLVVDGRVLGGLQLCFGDGRHPRDLDSDFLLTVADVTAQALARAALFDDLGRSEQLFRTLAEAAEQQVWIESPDGKIEYINPRAQEYLGVTLEEMRAADDMQVLRRRLWHPDDLRVATPRSLEARREGRMIDISIRIRRADGVYRTHLIRVVPQRDSAGVVRRWVGTATDVEQLLQAEAALREKEVPLRYLSDSAILGIATVDGDCTVTSANAAALAMLGFTAEDVAAGLVNLHALTPREHRERSDEAEHSLARGGHVAPYEKEYVRKDGRRVSVLVGGTSLGDAHGVFFLVDLSERKRIEREHGALVAQEQKFRDRLLGIVGHDLRNPLAAVSTWLQVLAQSPVLTGEDHAALARIDRTIGRMRRMIAQLLDFTHARQAGGIPVRPRHVDLGAVCREVIEELSSAHPGRLRLDAAAADLTGEWDPDRLQQMLSNLVGNALEHGDGGAVQVGVAAEIGAVRLEVHNRGPAIPEAELPRLFDPYRRARAASLTAQAGNLGLGLYIVEQIVHAHGGSIAVISTERQGTTFRVRLPRRMMPPR
jgi:PAS domain S-box-containing protein